MNGKIYLIQGQNQLRAMEEAPFVSEDLLQKLLGEYPDLLAGEQMNPDRPRRWILVDREMGVPDEAGAANRWSLDHLFLDQDGVPTLVEVKRSSDTRIRREVVGQMMDYAANAVVYWPIEMIRARWEKRAGDSAIQELKTLLCPSDTQEDFVEAFWNQVKTNLQAGKIRLVFVADVIPPELRRIVEFMNGQMDPAHVVAVEIRQFVGEGVQSLVPRVLGQTATAQQRKGQAPKMSREWDEAGFLDEVESRKGADARRVAQHLMEWSKTVFDGCIWGKGAKDGRISPQATWRDGSAYLFTIWTYGFVEVDFRLMKNHPFFAEEAHRRTLFEKLGELPGVKLTESDFESRPNIPLTVLAAPDAMRHFKGAMEWALANLKAAAMKDLSEGTPQ